MVSTIRTTSIATTASVTNAQIRAEVFLDGQVFKVWCVFDNKTLLVGQVKCANEAVARRDVGERLLWVHLREVVDDVGEIKCAVDGLHCGIVGGVWWRRCGDLTR